MFKQFVILLILSYSIIDLSKVEAVTSALKRQTLVFHEPPYENNLERTDQVTEHYITQRLDNFNHQNNRTFQMVLLSQHSCCSIFDIFFNHKKIHCRHQIIDSLLKSNENFVFSSDIWKMMFISKVAGQFSSWSAENGKLAPVISCPVSIFMIWPKRIMVCSFIRNIGSMAKPDPRSEFWIKNNFS